MEKQKFLVLGAGPAQIDLIELLKPNFEVHACSYDRSDLGVDDAVKYEQIDLKDKEAVLKYCQNQQINYIYSVGSDLAMPTAAWVSKQLELPSLIDAETAHVCQNKDLLREKLSDLKENVPYQLVTHSQQRLELDFPVIIKPVDSQGQRGVRKISSKQEFSRHFLSAAAHGQRHEVICEQYLPGQEYSVNAFARAGRVELAIITKRVVYPEYPGGLIHLHSTEHGLSHDLQITINKSVETVISKLNINNGPVYFQIKIVNGQPKVIEVSPRLDGCHLWRLFTHSHHIDLLTASVELLIGGEQSELQLKNSYLPEDGKHWVLEFFSTLPGTIFSKQNFNVRDDTVFNQFYYNDGEEVGVTNGYLEKCGYQIYQV